MDQTVKPVFEVKDLLDLSPIFESVVPSSTKNPIHSLGLLGELEKVTRTSLSASLSAANLLGTAEDSDKATAGAAESPALHSSVSANLTTTAARRASAQTVSQRMREMKVQVRPEYQGALSDPSVVEALLALHAEPEKKTEVHPQFETAQTPEVQATPKKNSHFRRSTRNTTPVLRS